MGWIREKKWVIGCIAMAIILSVFIVNNIGIYNQNNALKKEIIRNMNAEWYQLYRLSEIIDKNYIKNDFQDSEKFQLYVNQTCHHFSYTGGSTELTVNMRNFLVLSYDPLFTDLSLEKDPLNKEKAIELLKGMNDELMSISKDIIDMKDNEKEKLLNPKTSKFIEVNARVKEFADKYAKAVYDYFRQYGK